MSNPAEKFECYLVGGAVRDRLLGLPVKDRDWVVVRSTPEEMTRSGFKPVGKDFPVFLHPHTHEEYALARTERKTSPGYKGFAVHASSDVTLEQDLARRDLTINAIAETADGELIDPFDGAKDIANKILRHVSNAFIEDPVRILRVARFAARFGKRGFSIAPETMSLMGAMVEEGEVDHLVSERVWREMHGALLEPDPSMFIKTLHECGALEHVFPEIAALDGVPQVEKFHPEIDTLVHTLMALDMCASLTDDASVRFAVLAHDLGKALTPPEELPRHVRHEQRGIKPVKALCERLRTPKGYRDLALLVCEHHLKMHKLAELKSSTIFDLLKAIDTFRKPERLELFALACEADARGRKGRENNNYPQRQWLDEFWRAAKTVVAQDLIDSGLEGEQLGKEIHKRQITAIEQLKSRLTNGVKT